MKSYVRAASECEVIVSQPKSSVPILRFQQKRSFQAIALICVLMLTAVCVRAESERFRQYRSDYGLMSLDLLNNPAEIAQVKDFVYTKDAATFNFKDWKLIFLRYKDDRPTTALFIGTGTARIEIPHRLERENLRQISGDTLVDQSFEVCAIRFADDFDKLVKEKFSVTAGKLDWPDYNRVMKAQSETYFAPSIYAQFDNYTQLIWSAMKRNADGFFWIDFGRYAYSYDPHRPEQIDVLYEREAADEYLTIGARFQRAGQRPSSDFELSKITYPLKVSERVANLELGGLDGTHLKKAEVTLKATVLAEELWMIPIYVDRKQQVDSIWVNGVNAEFWTRNDFSRHYIFPKEPVKQGEELSIRVLFHGNDYSRTLPWVDDPAAIYTQVSYSAPKGFTYFAPGMSKVEVTGGRQLFSSQFDPLVRDQSFTAVATGNYDTVTLSTASGFPITFIKIRNYSRGGLADSKYQETILQSFDLLASILGNPPATFSLTVLPYGTRQAPGFASIPQQSSDLDGTGGFALTVAQILARQWLGITAQPAGEREEWLLEGMAQALSHLVVQRVKTSSEMFAEINNLWSQVDLGRERQYDRPIAGKMDWRIPKEENTGQTSTSVFMNQALFRSSKAGLVLNQLRFELYDLIGQEGDATYRQLLRELCSRINSAPFTNAEIAAMVAKRAGHDMTAFFDTFVFGGELPEISGSYHMVSAESGPAVAWDVTVSNVAANFSAPVVVRVKSGEENKLLRQMLTAGTNQFRTDGLSGEATEVEFNKFFSLLSRDNVKKGK